MIPFRDPCPKALHLGISVTHDQWSHHLHAYPHQTVPEANTHFPATCPPDQRQVPTLDYPRRGLTPGDKTVCEYRLWENDNYPIGKGQREEEARSPPNDLLLEVAEAAVCKIVGITRIQPTPKSFPMDTGDVVVLQAVERWKNCTAQDNSESSPAGSGCARQMRVRVARIQNVCCNHTRMRNPKTVRVSQSRRAQQCISVKATVGGFCRSGDP